MSGKASNDTNPFHEVILGSASDAASSTSEKNEKLWCPDLYPERQRHKPFGFWDIYSTYSNMKRFKKCESSISRIAKESFAVKMLLTALKSSGCPVNLRRHISCEKCAVDVSSGYDPHYFQVIMCHNNMYRERNYEVALTHELVHMFDHCRATVDFNDPYQLACTEIRAANIAHCNHHFTAYLEGEIPFRATKEAHYNCVRNKAANSIGRVLNLKPEEAYKVVDTVFMRCYNDMEPFGRRFEFRSQLPRIIFEQRRNYGYY